MKQKKRINVKAKGDRNQRKTAEWLRDKGFLVITSPRSSFRGDNDYFNRWDHIAVATKNTTIGISRISQGQTLYVQTKTNKMPGIKERYRLANFPAWLKVIVMWKDRVPDPVVRYLNIVSCALEMQNKGYTLDE